MIDLVRRFGMTAREAGRMLVLSVSMGSLSMREAIEFDSAMAAICSVAGVDYSFELREWIIARAAKMPLATPVMVAEDVFLAVSAGWSIEEVMDGP